MTDRDEAALSWAQRRFLAVLGLPALGIALAYTVVTTYAPVLLERASGPAITGALIGAEGLLALVVPVLVGGASDRVRLGGLGGRLPFVFAGAALAALALVFLPATADSLRWLAPTLAVFFIAYFIYYSPYYALYPDVVPPEAQGRSQGFQGTSRSVGLLAGIAGGGFLLEMWQPLPFLVAAVVLLVVTAGFYGGVRGRLGGEPAPAQGSNGFVDVANLVRRNRSIRMWAGANVCWEAAVAALRTFVVLYFTQGLGLSLHESALALALVGVAALAAAPVAGALADRHGPRPVMRVAVYAFAAGLLPTLFTTNPTFVIAIIPVAFAAVVLITLPFALLMSLLPSASDHGAGAGLFGFSRGLGVMLGPALAGGATRLLGSTDVLTFAATDGYSAIFAVAGVLLLVSVPFLRRVSPRHRHPERGGRPGGARPDRDASAGRDASP